MKKAEKRIDDIISKIKNGEHRVPKKCKTKERTYLKNKANWHLMGKCFSDNGDCVMCEKCVSACPSGNISLACGKITFADKCVACLGCYHRCPQKAIVYLNKRKKDRYINPFIDESSIGEDL